MMMSVGREGEGDSLDVGERKKENFRGKLEFCACGLPRFGFEAVGWSCEEKTSWPYSLIHLIIYVQQPTGSMFHTHQAVSMTPGITSLHIKVCSTNALIDDIWLDTSRLHLKTSTMLLPQALPSALTILLTIISPTNAYSKNIKPHKFTISLQRYADTNCQDPVGKWHFRTYDQRTSIPGDSNEIGGVCKNWKHDERSFGSYDFKWIVRRFHEADTAQDDPTLGKNGRRKECVITVYREKDCAGEAVHTLERANEWENIETCQQVGGGGGKSVRVMCFLR
ncbi:hypothetical protein DOTSEDRAFT_57460 [Dothistroma septosporum NZE10]|uniref:Uncharacterized protein n=1 Tax=Dothistroma septosporum (strain NZE10 / CBS 128990) TaxID=675120 RepID=N1PBH9_DOTSN|nr:hypothetical protein DOTSEDRAFT_57460 [Dothistroma septosporum NZE10]